MFVSKLFFEAEIAKVEETYKDVLNMTPEEIGEDDLHAVHRFSMRSRAIGMIDAYNKVLGRETDNGKYPCMKDWAQVAADQGYEPWASRETPSQG